MQCAELRETDVAPGVDDICQLTGRLVDVEVFLGCGVGGGEVEMGGGGSLRGGDGDKQLIIGSYLDWLHGGQFHYLCLRCDVAEISEVALRRAARAEKHKGGPGHHRK